MDDKDKLKAAAAGAGIVVIALALGVAVAPDSGSNERDEAAESAKAEEIKRAIDESNARMRAAAKIDPAQYSADVKAVRDLDPQIVDLLSPAAEPGATVTAGASFPRGARIVSQELNGKAVDNFALSLAPGTCVDKATSTWCEITATNTSREVLPLSAYVRYEIDEAAAVNVETKQTLTVAGQDYSAVTLDGTGWTCTTEDARTTCQLAAKP